MKLSDVREGDLLRYLGKGESDNEEECLIEGKVYTVTRDGPSARLFVHCRYVTHYLDLEDVAANHELAKHWAMVTPAVTML